MHLKFNLFSEIIALNILPSADFRDPNRGPKPP